MYHLEYEEFKEDEDETICEILLDVGLFCDIEEDMDGDEYTGPLEEEDIITNGNFAMFALSNDLLTNRHENFKEDRFRRSEHDDQFRFRDLRTTTNILRNAGVEYQTNESNNT